MKESGGKNDGRTRKNIEKLEKVQEPEGKAKRITY